MIALKRIVNGIGTITSSTPFTLRARPALILPAEISGDTIKLASSIVNKS